MPPPCFGDDGVLKEIVYRNCSRSSFAARTGFVATGESGVERSSIAGLHGYGLKLPDIGSGTGPSKFQCLSAHISSTHALTTVSKIVALFCAGGIPLVRTTRHRQSLRAYNFWSAGEWVDSGLGWRSFRFVFAYRPLYSSRKYDLFDSNCITSREADGSEGTAALGRRRTDARNWRQTWTKIESAPGPNFWRHLAISAAL
ncbi:hypothetical protein C8R46DRAFT_1040600 [Mycena filopes]|nr:hypothetical protein C8R46DRAFT_1040600 [Mycena filopes]